MAQAFSVWCTIFSFLAIKHTQWTQNQKDFLLGYFAIRQHMRQFIGSFICRRPPYVANLHSLFFSWVSSFFEISIHLMHILWSPLYKILAAETLRNQLMRSNQRANDPFDSLGISQSLLCHL